MSDSGLADDLFGGSDTGTPAPQVPSPAPVASGSRTPEIKPASPSGSASTVRQSPPRDPDEEDDGDLFGDDDEDEEKPVDSRARSSAPTTPASQRSGSPNPLEYQEEDVVEERNEVWANLAIPKKPRMQSSDGKVWHLKLPAYVNMTSEPYDAELYRELNKEDPIDGAKEPLLAKQKMLGVRNTIRWKWVTGPDGEPVPQSNSRIVRWSDGSVSLQVGSEYFDIATSHGATLARPEDVKPKASSQSQSRTPSNSQPTASSASNTTFLCVVAGDERVLVAETAIAGHLTLMPTSMTSKTHMELVKQVGQQHVKHSRMKLLDDIHDPAKLNELLLKAAGKEKVVPKKVRRTGSGAGGRGGGGGGRSGAGGRSGRRSAARAFSDSGSEGGDANVRAGRNDYDEDDGFVVADEDEEDEAEETEDEDEMAWGSTKKSKKKATGAGAGKKRKGSVDSLDEMEEAERKIEERERAAKRAKKDKGKVKKSRDYVDTDEEDGDGEEEDDVDDVDGEGEADGDDQDMDMDVESEDD